MNCPLRRMMEEVVADHNNSIFLQSISIIIDLKKVKLRAVMKAIVGTESHNSCRMVIGIGLSSIEQQLGFMRAPFCLGIPYFDALDSSSLAAEIDGACTTAGGDLVIDRQFLIAAICEMNDDSFECYRRALDTKLKRAESAVRTPDFDPIVIVHPIDIRITKINPGFGFAKSLGVNSLIKTRKQQPSYSY